MSILLQSGARLFTFLDLVRARFVVFKTLNLINYEAFEDVSGPDSKNLSV